MLPPGYQIIDARTLRSRKGETPAAAGVYLIRCSDPILLRDLDLAAGPEPRTIYVGRSRSLRQRIAHHMSGATSTSNFRLSLGLMLAHRLGLQAEVADVGSSMWFSDEALLSAFIDEHIDVAFAATDDARRVEARLIQGLQPPLNISQRSGRPSAVRLATARSALRAAHRAAKVGMSPLISGPDWGRPTTDGRQDAQARGCRDQAEANPTSMAPG